MLPIRFTFHESLKAKSPLCSGWKLASLMVPYMPRKETTSRKRSAFRNGMRLNKSQLAKYVRSHDAYWSKRNSIGVSNENDSGCIV